MMTQPTKPTLPKVVIVGRPNVGKSTLFNAIIKKRKAIVEKSSATTRDRITSIVAWQGKSFELSDSPGLDFAKKEGLCELVKKQVLSAIEDTGHILFLCDVKTGPVSLDYDICSMLRKSGKKITLVVNKVDNKILSEKALEFYNLGMGDPVSVSSLHATGIADLLDICVRHIGTAPGYSIKTRAIKLAIVGRPNSGKSSFVNAVLGEERVVVSPEPGTTRDSVDTYFEINNKPFVVIDTAGIRSKRKIKDAVTYFSILRAQESIKKSDVVVIILDAPLGATKEDSKIISLVQKALKPCVFAVNKWDLAKKEKINKVEYEQALRSMLAFSYHTPIVFISALKKENIYTVLEIAEELALKSKKNFSTSDLNHILKSIDFRPTRLYSIRQVRNAPPEFEVFAQNPALIDNSNKSYVVNRLRERLGLEGVPIPISFRKKGR